jgi:hypothetical protein
LKNILWISGRLPAPLFSGDALYTASMIRALAMSGARVTVVGSYRHEGHVAVGLDNISGVEWIGIAPSRRSPLASLLTGLPRDAYVLASTELRSMLQRLLIRNWDWIVIDHSNSAGALSSIREARKGAKICYVAHNVEAIVRPQVARESQGGLRRWAMLLDAEKYRRLELEIVQVADAIVAITPDDAAYFAAYHPNVHVVPPAFLGEGVEARTIDPSTPKSLLLVGSFEWVAKQRNLQKIVEVIQPALAAAGITLNVVGAVPPALKARLIAGRSHLRFHGRVPDVTDLVLLSRGGLVAELFGGGFKLKVLDYAFRRLPIFGLEQALAGMTPEEQSAMFVTTSLETLADVIVHRFEDIDELNLRQARLHDLISKRFGLVQVAERIGKVFDFH